MKDVMGIINDTTVTEGLKGMTFHRSLAAIPTAGRYRVIDFVMSNMVNSGIKNVGILTDNNYRSLMDHVESGREWDLATKREGLFILPPRYINGNYGSPSGDIHYYYNHLDYFQRSTQDIVIISGNNIICNIDYRRAVEYHKEKAADITILYKEDINAKGQSYSVIETNEEDRVTDLAVNTERKTSNKLSIEMYIMNKKVLFDMIDSCVSRGYCNLVKDGIIKNLDKYRILGYSHNGYLAKIDSVQSYYKHNMDLLDVNIWKELFQTGGTIYTKVKDEAPVKYMGDAEVKNAMVGNGCVIEGTVENSVLFRGVRVHKGAIIKNSIIMQKSEIEEGAVLENVILDKEVYITKGKQLKGEENYPVVIEKRAII